MLLSQSSRKSHNTQVCVLKKQAGTEHFESASVQQMRTHTSPTSQCTLHHTKFRGTLMAANAVQETCRDTSLTPRGCISTVSGHHVWMRHNPEALYLDIMSGRGPTCKVMQNEIIGSVNYSKALGQRTQTPCSEQCEQFTNTTENNITDNNMTHFSSVHVHVMPNRLK